MAVCVGAVMQRVSGMGFALIVSPFVIIALGPLQGIVLVNVCGAVTAVVMWALLRADVEWSRLGWITLSSPFGAGAGLLLASRVDTDALYIVVGAALILGLFASLYASRLDTTVTGRTPALVAGFATGALVTTAGVGAPPMTIYAELADWGQRSFAASMQPFTFIISAFGAGLTLLVPGSAPHLTTTQWAAVIASMTLGTVIGVLVGRRIPLRTARYLVLAIALAGATITLGRGIISITQ